MKTLVKITTSLLLIVAFPLVALADAPTVTITSPQTGTTIYVPSFPATIPVSFNIIHYELKNLNVLNVKVDEDSIWSSGPIGNPFTNVNGCSGDMVLPRISACSTDSSGDASVTAPWLVTDAGTYAVEVSLKHQGQDVGFDEEDIQLLLVSVEWPAPPSVANAYIKSQGNKLSAGRRGCIISKIANNHAMDSKYGSKGGPYSTSDIQSDVNFYMNGECAF